MEKNKFILKQENIPSEFQLSFDDFKTLSENSEVTSKIPYVDYLLLDGQDFHFPSKRYFVISLVIHSLLFATVLFFSLHPELLPQEAPKKELITIELEPASQGSSGAAASTSNMAVPAVAAAPAALPETMSAQDVAVPVASVKKETPKAAIPAPVKAKASPKTATAAKTSLPAATTAVETFEPTNSIDDIAVPALTEINDSETNSAAKTTPILEDIKSNLDEIDQDSNAKVLAANQELEEMSHQQMNDMESQSSAISEEEDPLENVAEQRKNQLAQERKALAAQAAAALAAQKAAAAKAQQQRGHGNGKNSQGGSSLSDSAGNSSEGEGHSIGNSISQSGAGTGEGQIRKLEELRQMPGNKKPEYDNEDRLKGLSGTIVMYGFVTKEGSLSSFKMIQSTGHRSLDKKTLVALKKWRFYPGQEGWVELPFKWDLKGGVQQKPTLLKRR